MMKRHRFHREARLEYIEALLHLEGQRVGYGAKFEAEVEAVLKSRSSTPSPTNIENRSTGSTGSRKTGFGIDLDARGHGLMRFWRRAPARTDDRQPACSSGAAAAKRWRPVVVHQSIQARAATSRALRSPWAENGMR